MKRLPQGLTVLLLFLGFISPAGPATACPYLQECVEPGLSNGSATIGLTTAQAGQFIGADTAAADYEWRLRTLCEISDEAEGACSPSDFRPCPQDPGRVIRFLVLEQRPIVRTDGTVVDGSSADGLLPGDPAGPWDEARPGSCLDITSLNPPPSPGEVFSYFERLPLPELAAKHQPPGNGLSGLPVIFYTDEATTQTFTVDIRGFEVVIDAGATSFTWNTGDPTDPTIVTDHPGAPYPDQTITHEYASGTYTASLTVTWGATFSVDGSAPANVPGTTTTEGPPVTFDVLESRPVLVNPN